ncbi:MAG: sugar-binding protein [Candidatus Woesearchaeota archaeon]
MRQKSNLITLFLIFSLALAPINAFADEKDIDQVFTGSANALELGNFAKITPLEDDGIQAKSEHQDLLTTLTNEIDSSNSIALTVGSSGAGESGSYNVSFVIDQPSGFNMDPLLNSIHLPFIYLIDPNETQQLNCTVINSILQRGTCVNSTKLDSTALDSNNLDSYIDNSYESFCDATLAALTLTDCINSSVTDTDPSNSTITSSSIDQSAVDNSIISSSSFTLSVILDSTIINSTLTDCNVTDSYVSQTDCTLSEILNSTIDCPNRVNIENGVLLDNVLQSGAIHYGGLTYGTGADIGEICSTAPRINIITPNAGQVVGNITNVIVNTSANNTPKLFIRNEPIGRDLIYNYSTIWYYFWDTTEYPDGDTNIRANDFDYYGNPGEDSRDVIVDNTPPVITITSPTVSLTALQNIILSGSIIDQTTYVREANYSILNETGSITESGPLTLTSNSFSKQVTLSEFQNNTIIVCAVDHENVNNSACLQKNITQSTGAPFAEILAPPNNTITDLPNINVTTNVSNAVVAYLFVNGVALTSTINKNGTGTYVASLTQGLNQLQIQAIGETGVSGFSETVNVFYRPELPPSIGEFVSSLNLVRNGTTVEFSFQGASPDYNVTVFPILLNDNLPALDLNYAGNGWYNNSMLVNSSQPDGPKAIYMNASINSSYDYTASVVITLDNTHPVGSIKINNDDEQTSNALVDLQMVYLDNYGVKECRLSNYPFESESSGQSFSFSEDFADEDNIELDQTDADLDSGGVSLYNQLVDLESANISSTQVLNAISSHDYTNATLFNDTIELKFANTDNVTHASLCIESSAANRSSSLDVYLFNGSDFTLKTGLDFTGTPSTQCAPLSQDELNKTIAGQLIIKANHSDNVSVEYINHIFLINQTNSTTRYQAKNNITSKTVVTTLLDIDMATMFASETYPEVGKYLDKLNDTYNDTVLTPSNSFYLVLPKNATVILSEFVVNGSVDDDVEFLILNNSIGSAPDLNGAQTISGFQNQINDYLNNACTTSICNIPIVYNDVNFTSTIGTPVIDGNSSDWAGVEGKFIPATSLASGNLSDETDTSATVKSMWDNNSLYVLVEVNDDILVNDSNINSPWHDDSVEIYLDIGNEKAENYDNNDYQLDISYNGVYRKGVYSQNFTDIQYITSLTPSGYLVEAALNFTSLNMTPDNGTFIGFDIGINDDDDPLVNSPIDDRERQLIYVGTKDDWISPSGFGNLQLINSDYSVEISNVSLSYTIPVGKITYYMASDGINFEQVNLSEPHSFADLGNALRWKAVIETNDDTVTPTLSSIDIVSEGTIWEPCTSQKVWKLIETAIGIEERTVYYQIKDNVGWITDVNDTILLNKTSEILDWTAPVNLTIWVDNWTNSEGTLEARWRAFDRESKVFYQYRIYHEGSQTFPSSGWLDAPDYGQAEFVSVNLSEEIDHILGDGDRYYFEVRALNSYYINSSPVMSDPIGVDRNPPEMPENLVSSFILDGCVNTSIGNFEWEEPDDNGDSGIKGYSYIITTDINATPDEIPEGDPYNLDQFLSLNVSGLSDNLYYFKVRAVDNAGNGGDTANWAFHVDTIRPGPPQIEDYGQYANLSTLNLGWIASQDGRGCGIDYYKVMVYNDSDLSVFEKEQSTSDNSTSLTITGLAQEQTYYFVIYAYDLAGWESLPSSVMRGGIDTTDPTIQWIKPIGLIAALTPTIAYTTSEDAECWLNGVTAMFHTNSTYHERRGPPLGGSGSLYAECFDIPVRNPGDNLPGVDYTVDLNANVSSVVIGSDNPFYIGEEVIINAALKSGSTPSGSTPIGEIRKSRVEVFFDGKPLDDFGWSDKGAGDYQVTFDSPLEEGIYNITINVDGAMSNVHPINITELLLTMTYSSTFSDSQEKIIYREGANYTIGFATDSSKAVHDNSTMNAGTSDGISYIFVTKKGSNLKQRNAYLRDKEFGDFINPSFGYEIEKEMYVLNTQLAYDDIVIQGARGQVPSGRYNLIIRNLGLDEDGNTIIEVDIT